MRGRRDNLEEDNRVRVGKLLEHVVGSRKVDEGTAVAVGGLKQQQE
jgi:hypothetical protein